MSWNYTKDKLPHTYITGDFDGKESDYMLVQCKDYKYHIAKFNDGILDGQIFEEWYDNDNYDLGQEVIKWMEIPY